MTPPVPVQSVEAGAAPLRFLIFDQKCFLGKRNRPDSKFARKTSPVEVILCPLLLSMDLYPK